MRALALLFCVCSALLLSGCSISAGGSFIFTDADQRLAIDEMVGHTKGEIVAGLVIALVVATDAA